MKRIETLSAEQQQLMKQYRDKWLAIGLSTEPANRADAERGIELAYAAAGLAKPQIVWCGSPLSQGLTRAVLKDRALWDSVWASVWDSVWASVGASVRASVWDSVRDSVWASVRASVGDSVRASVWDSVRDSVWASVRASVWDSVWASVWASVRASVGDSVRDSVGDSGYGQHDAGWLAFYEYFHDACGLVAHTEKLGGLWLIAQSAGWFLPHRGMCFISERHNVCKLKDGRIHSEAGPAIAYPDGFAIYALNGVRVPEWLVQTAERDLDPLRLTTIDNAEVRREFVRKVGAERICQALSTGPINSATYRTKDGREHPYELHRFAVAGEQWTYLKMLNPSVGLTHFEGVPNECQTVQQALNFRNGLTAKQVSPNGAEWHQQGDVLMFPQGATKFQPFPASIS